MKFNRVASTALNHFSTVIVLLSFSCFFQQSPSGSNTEEVLERLKLALCGRFASDGLDGERGRIVVVGDDGEVSFASENMNLERGAKLSLESSAVYINNIGCLSLRYCSS
jgi:hypothetical protein